VFEEVEETFDYIPVSVSRLVVSATRPLPARDHRLRLLAANLLSQFRTVVALVRDHILR
jgi:hypothetical protein